MNLYRQCTLTQGSTEQTSWLPVKYAVVGKMLRLKSHGKWEPGLWKVEWASKDTITEEQLDAMEKMHRLGRSGAQIG